ncbi:MAG: RNA polymerase sigma factor [Verrucomicrobia subdivision 3 bacterium]|nr:RNA polymerase sigma factor [Limisphaerales bacterium]
MLQTIVDAADFEQLVNAHYEGLFAFALSLTHDRHEASELTQETFCRLAVKGGQIRDRNKRKQWLFTTLYRIFLGWKRRETRLPHFELASVAEELPVLSSTVIDEIDARLVLEALCQVDERYRSPLVLYYLDEHSYEEIGHILEIPAGTVMSRLSRGKELLRQMLDAKMSEDGKIVPLNSSKQAQRR